MAIETERKFLVGIVPELPRFLRPLQITQHYIARADGLEVRLRQAGRRHWLTIKTGKGLERKELETSLSAKQYSSLQESADTPHLSKLRYRLPLDSGCAELDIYDGELTGLKVVEVEFPDTAAAASFIPPFWFGPEVTNDPQFSNANLADLDRETARKNLGALLDPPQLSFGAIPIIKEEERIRIVIVSTKSRSRWIFPKGTPEDGKSPQSIALVEAQEEAGVEGRLVGKPLAMGYWRDRQCSRIEYWPLLVSAVHSEWDEDSVRQRIICSPDEAREYLANPAFVQILDEALANSGLANA